MIDHSDPFKNIPSRYRVDKTLSRGPSSVAIAQDQIYDRKVIIKIVEPASAQAKREIDALQVMRCDFTPILFEGDIERGMLVMEYFAGPSLRSFLTKAQSSRNESVSGVQPRFSWGVVCKISLGVLATLEHVYSKGYVHMDIKPENLILLDLGTQTHDIWHSNLEELKQIRVAIVDFGGACKVSDPTELYSEAGPTRQFTHGYAAPEVLGLSSEAVHSRADIYSLGMVMRELLTGDNPHHGEETVPINRLNLAKTRKQLLKRLTADDPSQRISTLGETREALTRQLPAVASSGSGAQTSLARPVVMVGLSVLGLCVLLVTLWASDWALARLGLTRMGVSPAPAPIKDEAEDGSRGEAGTTSASAPDETTGSALMVIPPPPPETSRAGTRTDPPGARVPAPSPKPKVVETERDHVDRVPGVRRESAPSCESVRARLEPEVKRKCFRPTMGTHSAVVRMQIDGARMTNVEIEWSRGKSAEGIPTGQYIESTRICVENYHVPDDLQMERACPTTFTFTNEA